MEFSLFELFVEKGEFTKEVRRLGSLVKEPRAAVMHIDVDAVRMNRLQFSRCKSFVREIPKVIFPHPFRALVLWGFIGSERGNL